MIDLRSDTVTRPTPEMRQAMASAEVGDDVYGEDPTVNRLEERAAEIFGKPAALFVPTGTMGNTIALKVHTRHGQEVICEARSHVFNYELAMMAWFCGCLARPVSAPDGRLHWDLVAPVLKGNSPHVAPSALLSIENSHNMAGGTVQDASDIGALAERAHSAGLKVHMDGARIFNAAAALGQSVRDLAAPVDTVMFCLSKGLGAPAGSMLAGPAESIALGRHYRKRLGGGMRQAGVLAAAGLIALEQMPQRLAEDHANAAYLARELGGIAGLRTNQPQTNIVMLQVDGSGLTAAAFSDELKKHGVLANAIDSSTIRLLTHFDVSRAGCQRAVEAIRKVAAPQSRPAAVTN